MLSVARPQGRCIYCAFRSHQLALQARRLRSTATESSRISYNSGTRHKRLDLSKVNYDAGPGRGRDRLRPDGGFAGREGVVRKFFKGAEGSGFKGNPNIQERKQDFAEALQARLFKIKDELKDTPIIEALQRENERPQSFSKIWRAFTQKLTSGGPRRVAFFGEEAEEGDKSTLQDLRKAYRERGNNGLDDRIKYAFYGHVTGARFTESDIKNQKALADLRYPTEWFPATRAMHRTIHLHVGPTNSGKTYHALQRLEQAEKGVYAGPLRLLAHEVYSRMNAKGKKCALITGEERRAADEEGATLGDMSACTVEMMPLNKTLDVAVIDEIQMIGNFDRGWAWTQAVLGVKAKEVHLCGEARTVPLIRELCASVGEKLEIHEYERLSPLKMSEESLNGNMKKLRKGDCIVSFSVMGIHALRRQIERATGKKVATVYGSLPPETRAQQARLFNDPNNDYDYLVASDAVGMGLNLAIKRMIFETSNKFDGYQRRTLSVADIKQIGGRAGRYRTATQDMNQAMSEQSLAAAKGDAPAGPVVPTRPAPSTDEESVGLVTTLEKFDFPVVKAAMESEPEPIRTAGLFPPAPVLERFASYFPPGTPFSYILTRLHELSQMHQRFHLCGLKDQVWVADIIEPVQGLTINDRNVICSAPASKTDMDLWKNLMPSLAKIIAEQSGGSLLDIEELPLEVLEAEVSPSREYLRELERLHKGIVGYLWLSYRFAGIFSTRALAFHVKGLVEEKIEQVLSQFSFSETSRRKIAAKREQAVIQEIEGALLDEAGNPIEDATTSEDVRSAPIDEEDDDVDEEEDADEEDDDDEEAPVQTEEQTSLISGRDHFSGEEIEFEEPEAMDALEEAQDTREDSQSAKQDDIDSIIADATAEREETGLQAAQDGMPPRETQQVPPKPVEDRIAAPGQRPAGQSKFGGIPPKHLAHLDVNATEVERNADSRP